MQIMSSDPPNNCPYCGSGDLRSAVFSNMSYTQRTFCMDCERYWTEVFFIIPDEWEELVR